MDDSLGQNMEDVQEQNPVASQDNEASMPEESVPATDDGTEGNVILTGDSREELEEKVSEFRNLYEGYTLSAGAVAFSGTDKDYSINIAIKKEQQ